MSRVLDELLALLKLEPIEENLFRGASQDLGYRQLFGGQVLGQALSAATRTVEPVRHVHSMHGSFLRPGDPLLPVVYTVDRVRDGGSFTTRRVVAIQSTCGSAPPGRSRRTRRCTSTCSPMPPTSTSSPPRRSRTA